MIDAVKAGAHVYVQKPISVDVIEGEAMVAAARKYNKVVQVGTQRKSTPHLIDAKKNIVDAGLLGNIKHIEMCCYFHMRNNGNPPVQAVPRFPSTTKCGRVRHHYALTMDSPTFAGGEHSRNMATELWATCVFTCSTRFAG